MERRVMSAKDIHEQTGLSLPKVYELLNQEDFPSIRVGRRILVPTASFEAWLLQSAANKAEIPLGR